MKSNASSPLQPKSKFKLLFFSEAVTIAHLTRPLVLATALDPENYEIHFATSQLPDHLRAEAKNLNVHHLKSFIKPMDFQKSIYLTGKLPFTADQLLNSYDEDLELIRKLQPDLVIGDFRQSLRASSQHSQVPFINLTNFYWHIESGLKPEVPETLFTHILGVPICQFVFSQLHTVIFHLSVKPFNLFRKRLGMKDLNDIRDALTDADLNVFADLTSMYRPQAEFTDKFLGPILFSLKTPRSVPVVLPKKGHVLVTLGSSGNYKILKPLLEGLRAFDLSVVVVGAPEAAQEDFQTPQFHFLPFTDIDTLMKQSLFLVCNGGSPSTSMAISNGIPILGIPSNLDQQLNMKLIEMHRLGVKLRSERVTPKRVKKLVSCLVESKEFFENAKHWQHMATSSDAQKAFSDLVAQVLKPVTIEKLSDTKINAILKK